jgi:outer membrane protein insertion porin family
VVQRDVRKLADLGWFVDVKSLYETTPQGRVVIFRVVERPTIRYVEYLGNYYVKDKTLGKQTLLKVGGSVDPYAVEEGRRKLQEYYVGRGFNQAQVTVMEGNKATDQGVVYVINEGVAQRIRKVEFVGNEFVSGSRLKTKIKSKPPILGIFKGYVDRDMIAADVDRLTEFYRSYGYFQARVGRTVTPNEKGSRAVVTFVIHEGMRYQVRDVRFLGNTKFDQAAMSAAAKMQGGQPFEQAKMEADAQLVQDLYGSHGYVFADIQPQTVFLEQPGQVDLVYNINEGKRWRVGRIFVHIGGDSPHTRIQTALNRVTVRPGEILDIRELKASERRLLASSLFHVDPASNTRPKITYRIPEDAELEFAESEGKVRGQSPDEFGSGVAAPPGTSGWQQGMPAAAPAVSMQAIDMHVYCVDDAHYERWQAAEGNPADAGAATDAPADRPVLLQPSPTDRGAYELLPAPGKPVPEYTAPEMVVRGQSPQPAPPAGDWWSPTRREAKHIVRKPGDAYGQLPTSQPQQANAGYVNQAYAAVPPAATSGSPYGGQVVRATGPESAPVAGQGVQPAQYSSQIQPPAGSVAPTPLSPQGPLPYYSVDPSSPFYAAPELPAYPEGTVDIFIEGQETQTGRLMMGVGVNSDAGVVGNVVIDERNFDWTRFPTSWEDFRNGSAWRGAGQRLRIDASPGSEVSRYLISFQEPYLFDRPVSLGLSGSYYDRRFNDWDEQRIGGRVSLGYQWVERDLSAIASYRGENINIHDPSVPFGFVPELDEVLGDNVLHGFKLTLINDTRDNAFLATQGHYLEIGGEQVIGSFDYPKVDIDFRKYFMLYERPDHSGRHVLSLSTTIGYTGTNTPIYEHYFAGGFSTLRGFDFRGASPIDPVFNVELGGEFQWLNSIQYLFPITADDMLHGVVFCDFGTVEEDVTVKDFRVAPGAGLRITVPAMGPAPIALDFAWAVERSDFDDPEVFSFSLGFSR